MAYKHLVTRHTVYEDLTTEQICEHYRAGRSMDELGFATGTSSHKVRKLLVEHGVTIRPAFGHRMGSPCRYMRK
jgi:hypothetical protein